MFRFYPTTLMIDKLICSNQSSLLEAMNSINKNSLGVCFVVDAAGCLKGVLTDGDIRRALLKGVSPNVRIRSILSSDFVYGNIGESNSDLMSKIDDKVRIIPIVDNSFKVVDFFEYEHKAHIPVANPSLNGNEFKYLTDAFFSSWISSTGAYINKFEEDFSNYSDCTYGISVSNGTVALIRNPDILILDEATSSLDYESEKIIRNSLESLSHKLTIISVTHRPSMAEHSDMIYVFDKDSVVESGNYKSLIENKGFFLNLMSGDS